MVSGAGKDWVSNKNIKILGVADPNAASPFFNQAVTGQIYANTLPTSDANAVLGLWFNISQGANSTAAPNWLGYNFTSTAYPDMLYNATILASLQAQLGGISGLTPNAYLADLNQVRWLGQRNSVYRSAKQTNIAYFWRLGGGTPAVPGMFSQIATALLQGNWSSAADLQTGGGLYASSALFARMHTAIWDGCVSGWVAKYKFLHWRPETALRYGDNSTLTFNTTGYTTKALNWPSEVTPVYSTPTAPTDGTFTPLFNPSGQVPSSSAQLTAPATDPTGATKAQLHLAWTPELATPGHPEYPSSASRRVARALACEHAAAAASSDTCCAASPAPSPPQRTRSAARRRSPRCACSSAPTT